VGRQRAIENIAGYVLMR